MKKILIIASLEKHFATSGVGKYILPYTEYMTNQYEVSFLFQPAHHGMVRGFLRRIFILPNILKKRYKNHIKIFYDENFIVLWRSRMKKSTIYIIHHYPGLIKNKTITEYIMKYVHYFCFKYILKQVEYIVTVSQFTYTLLESKFFLKKKNLFCIENAIDNTLYRPISKEKYTLQKAELTGKYYLQKGNMLLCIAGAEYRKNIPTLIKLLHNLPNNYFLVRVGKHIPGRENSIITSLIKKYNLKKRYIHLTSINETDLIKFYQCAHLLLFPSLFEGFGRPPLEAQACGCPVLSTHSGALGEVLGTSAYIIKNPYDVEEWKHGIEEMKAEKRRKEFIKKGEANAKNYGKKKLYEKRNILLHQVVLYK